MELCENTICEWVQENYLKVNYVAGKCNPSNIFTKKMKDGAYFRRLHESFMYCLGEFLHDSPAQSFQNQRTTYVAQ